MMLNEKGLSVSDKSVSDKYCFVPIEEIPIVNLMHMTPQLAKFVNNAQKFTDEQFNDPAIDTEIKLLNTLREQVEEIYCNKNVNAGDK